MNNMLCSHIILLGRMAGCSHCIGQHSASLESKLNTLIPFISTFLFYFSPYYIKERFFSQISCYVCIIVFRKGQKIEAGILDLAQLALSRTRVPKMTMT